MASFNLYKTLPALLGQTGSKASSIVELANLIEDDLDLIFSISDFSRIEEARAAYNKAAENIGILQTEYNTEPWPGLMEKFKNAETHINALVPTKTDTPYTPPPAKQPGGSNLNKQGTGLDKTKVPKEEEFDFTKLILPGAIAAGAVLFFAMR